MQNTHKTNLSSYNKVDENHELGKIYFSVELSKEYSYIENLYIDNINMVFVKINKRDLNTLECEEIIRESFKDFGVVSVKKINKDTSKRYIHLNEDLIFASTIMVERENKQDDSISISEIQKIEDELYIKDEKLELQAIQNKKEFYRELQDNPSTDLPTQTQAIIKLDVLNELLVDIKHLRQPNLFNMEELEAV